MGKIPVFLDSDVIISALFSKSGASYEIIGNSKINKHVSLSIKKEVREVAKRLKICDKEAEKALRKCNIKSLGLSKKEIIKSYSTYVIDEEDSHVIAGAHISKSKFLLSHNRRHYRIDKINADFGIIVLKPGNFLQYLRSLNSH